LLSESKKITVAKGYNLYASTYLVWPFNSECAHFVMRKISIVSSNETLEVKKTSFAQKPDTAA